MMMTTKEEQEVMEPEEIEERRRELRERLGRRVREVWIEWAKTQPNPKPSWLQPWEELTEPEREVDRMIGEAIYDDTLDEDEAKSRALEAQLDIRRDDLRQERERTKHWRDRATKPKSQWLAWCLLLLTTVSLFLSAHVIDLVPEPVTCPEPVECPVAPAEPATPSAPTEARGYITGDEFGIPMVVPWPDTSNYPADVFRDDCVQVCAQPGPGMDGVPGRVLQVDPSHLICICFHPGEPWPVTRWINWERNP